MTEPRPGGMGLDPGVLAVMRARLPSVAGRAVDAITAEVTQYAGPMRGEMRGVIEQAVQTALGAFLRLAAESEDADPGTPLQPAVEGAYALGRGEARSGRTMDALLAAYRVGARVSWRELSAAAVAQDLPAEALARFAELVFAYIDQLSAASVAGHSDELARSGRAREQDVERLAVALLTGASEEELLRRAERADWTPPDSLTAVLLPSSRAHGAVSLLDPRTLHVGGDLTDAVLPPDHDVLLVPDAAASRAALLRALHDRGAVVGPARPWTSARTSFLRAVRAQEALPHSDRSSVDTDEHLAELVLLADPEALADLRAQALAPLAGLRPATADRLAETLLSWLLHQGRREEVAAELLVHPQTVRYRMTQLRDLYGDRLTDPREVLRLVVALGVPAAALRWRR